MNFQKHPRLRFPERRTAALITPLRVSLSSRFHAAT